MNIKNFVSKQYSKYYPDTPIEIEERMKMSSLSYENLMYKSWKFIWNLIK